jgi:oxygen-dependent protoporphyrinogen oxidase
VKDINQNVKQVVIVGGGIAGLSTAWYLQKQIQEQGLDLRYSVLERSDRWGGKILTERVDGFGNSPFIVEGGPDSFLTQKPWAVQLARELGLDDRLLGTNDDKRKVFVLNRGRPTPLPDGVLLIVPTKIMPFALSPLISPLGKLRMGLDLFIPPKRDGKDETLADFINRRLGKEALDKIAEPLMSGIYNAEAERQSLMATFPRFRDLESKHGSLIKGMLAARRARNNGSSPVSSKDEALSMFVSLPGGTVELIDTLVGQLMGDLRLNVQVTRLFKQESTFGIELADGKILTADAIVLAVPAYNAAKLIKELAPEAADKMNTIRYVSTGTISLAYRHDDIRLIDGFGLVIPRSQDRLINAVTFTSNKFNDRAPSGYGLLRVFFGGSRNPGMMEVPDDGLLETVQRELRALLKIEAEPIFNRIYRWHQANPQYDVGHLSLVKAIEDGLPAGVLVTGSPYRGIGIPDCVHQGQLAADQLTDRLNRDDLDSERDFRPPKSRLAS